jgi:hypothetical protein
MEEMVHRECFTGKVTPACLHLLPHNLLHSCSLSLQLRLTVRLLFIRQT